MKLDWPRPFAGLRGISAADLPREISAGLTLAALIIPLNIGYAQIAGLPPSLGLYSAIVPLLLFALFASSRHVVGGPGPATAALVAAALVGFAAPGETLRTEYALGRFKKSFPGKFLKGSVIHGGEQSQKRSDWTVWPWDDGTH